VARDRRAALVAAGLLAWLAQPANALTEAEQRGKQIYFEGTSPRGALINAVVGDEASIIPAAAIPCANCHGYDGLGRPEGGVTPTDVRWSQLIKTYGHVHEDGRRHPAFDDESLTRSIIAGVDPANNRLDTSMPLYLLSGDDAADLVAYLKVLEQDFDPGVEEDRVRVATMLPREGRAAPLGDAMEKVLRAHFADVNEHGGVFGRQIELVTVPLGETPGVSLENLQKAMDTNSVFALVGGYTIGLDDQLLELIRYDNVPLVGPFTLDPGDALLNSAAFYLYPGFREQVRVLADQAFGHASTAGKILIANPDSGRHDDLVRTAERQLRRVGAGEPAVVSYVAGKGNASALAERVRTQGAESVVFFGVQPDLDALLVQLAIRDLTPNVYVLSSFLSKPLFDAPATLDRHVIVAYPTLASDISPKGREDYQDLAKRHGLPTGHIQAQVASFAAARLFVEGLQRAGRDLDRIRLAESIEKLYNWDTGVTPPLTYGPNRRIGASGAHLMILDLENKTMRPVGDGWHNIR
jgi:ABC-type branched-subunit amino acid transport system substrate-binding protein